MTSAPTRDQRGRELVRQSLDLDLDAVVLSRGQAMQDGVIARAATSIASTARRAGRRVTSCERAL
jgi:hypothetical protein